MDKEEILASLEYKFAQLAGEVEKIDQKLLSGEYEVEDLRRRNRFDNILTRYKRYQDLSSNISFLCGLLETETDEDILSEAQSEIESDRKEIEQTVDELLLGVLPQDKDEDADKVIVEVGAGAGGEEAGIFAFDLLEMYRRYSLNNSLKCEIIELNYNDSGGIKNGTAIVSGEGVYRNLKYEGGVHRVQRVPKTESQGRIHTSTATVAIMPEPKTVEVEVKPSDIRIDSMRSSGSGGQSVNTTDSAVRITHIPTGVVVTCQDEKSQQKNKDKAMEVLKTRLYNLEKERAEAERNESLRSQVGSGERGEKIRTYNFPQDRVTDHRIQFSINQIEKFMAGEIGEMVNALQKAELEEKIRSAGLV